MRTAVMGVATIAVLLLAGAFVPVSAQAATISHGPTISRGPSPYPFTGGDMCAPGYYAGNAWWGFLWNLFVTFMSFACAF